ncbi:hypothetical protein SAMN04487926_1318 [Paraburkholderia steynii]|uniref:Uncharacterized protein n=1 Tax=Paraburkholderia steynii TaxID=1245441 RepID=A0A7Z7FL00_9BURK|nr:hypothetical protein [Paraburkholderia steynii]SDJ04219.1 hypothetical protein SAMN04487926_1318 [Paraburkholderia steynii]
MATELKTDAWHRYVMYRSDDTSLLRIASTEDGRKAIDAGKTFTRRAYADVWAKDADLVDRVRRFLGKNFHWHARLSESGSDLEVVEMLQMMVRGGSIHVIAQEPARVGSAASETEKPKSSFWGADHYSHIFDVSFAERYRDQLKAMNAGGPTLADICAMNDSVNAEFMHAAVLADPLGTLSVFARAGWVSRYGLPDLTEYGVDDKADIADQYIGAPTQLDSAEPYRLTDGVLVDESSSIQLAGRLTPNTGEPGTWYTNPGSGQMRLFGADGKPVVDFDFDHDHGQGIPHAHNWNDGGGPYPVRGPGIRFSPLP